MLKIDKLMFAMCQHEGWTPAGAPGNPTGSVAFRHHNPGNLRSSIFQSSVVDGFAVFSSDLVGWMALQHDISMKAMGKTTTGLNGESTLEDFIKVWAPSSDGNDTKAYLNAVCAQSGFLPTMKLKELLN